MKQSKKNAFTLIELVVVLVIMAIIALIVTPLVMSIIKKEKISAYKRSVDAWVNTIVKSTDTAIARLITYTEIDNNFDFEEFDPCGGCVAKVERLSASWMYSKNYNYWTMSSYDDSESNVWKVDLNCVVNSHSVDGDVYNELLAVRPVLELNKSAEITKLN